MIDTNFLIIATTKPLLPGPLSESPNNAVRTIGIAFCVTLHFTIAYRSSKIIFMKMEKRNYYYCIYFHNKKHEIV